MVMIIIRYLRFCVGVAGRSGLRRQDVGFQLPDGPGVARDALAGDGQKAGGPDVGHLPERLPPLDGGDVHLHRRQIARP